MEKYKTKADWTMTIIALFVIIGGGYFMAETFLKKSAAAVNIPCGSYALVKNSTKGPEVVTHAIDVAKVQAKGLGNSLLVVGDSVEATNLFTALAGSPAKFPIKKTATVNMYDLVLPGNTLAMELTSQGRLRIYMSSSDSLVYEKE